MPKIYSPHANLKEQSSTSDKIILPGHYLQVALSGFLNAINGIPYDYERSMCTRMRPQRLLSMTAKTVKAFGA